ncbi:MAG TPA: hypothetical protein VMV31_02040 [Terriglobales bacterium]|nr:hypothetical protein [Terriglobales bacterium]
MSEKLRIREAEYFLGMIGEFERRYQKSSNLFLVEFYSGKLDQEDDDFGTWAFLCKAFEDSLCEQPADTGPPVAEPTFARDEPYIGARCILGVFVGAIRRAIRRRVHAADRVADRQLWRRHFAALGWT